MGGTAAVVNSGEQAGAGFECGGDVCVVSDVGWVATKASDLTRRLVLLLRARGNNIPGSAPLLESKRPQWQSR